MTKIISFEAEKKKSEQKKLSLKEHQQKIFASLKEHQQKIFASLKEASTLVWLYCPTCKTLEYTEVVHPEGRLHKCGTAVLEEEVSIDITAEYTICERNLIYLEKFKNNFLQINEKKIKKEHSKQDIANFQTLIVNLKGFEQTMIKKLQQMTKNKKLLSYPWTAENIKALPIAHIHKLGLIVSRFRFQPTARFKKMGVVFDEKNNKKNDFLKD